MIRFIIYFSLFFPLISNGENLMVIPKENDCVVTVLMKQENKAEAKAISVVHAHINRPGENVEVEYLLERKEGGLVSSAIFRYTKLGVKYKLTAPIHDMEIDGEDIIIAKKVHKVELKRGEDNLIIYKIPLLKTRTMNTYLNVYVTGSGNLLKKYLPLKKGPTEFENFIK